jgi:hypothetical protein
MASLRSQLENKKWHIKPCQNGENESLLLPGIYCWNTPTSSTIDSVPYETGNRIPRIMNGAPEYLISGCHPSGSIQTVYSVSGFITLCASWNIRQTIQSCWWPLFTHQTYRCGGKHPDRQCLHYPFLHTKYNQNFLITRHSMKRTMTTL